MSSAIVFDQPGPPAVLQWRDVPPLLPRAHEVVIGVEAAGVNNADLMQRRGHYPVPAWAPRPLGLECAGTITAVGTDVARWSVGDRVCALLDGGGYADEVAVPATQVMPIPRGLTVVQAAAVPEVAATVYSNLAMTAGLTEGQTVLIHGAGGGIGTFAIQWATAIGAHVITTAGSDAKVRIGLELGAHTAINYRDHDFVSATLKATNGRGVDAILDVVGSDYLARNLECLAADGHLVIIGGSTTPTLLDIGLLMSKRASVTATMLRARPIHQKADIIAGVTRDVLPLFESGTVRVVVDTIVPMAEAARAHQLLESKQTVGKVILDNRGRRQL
ncbi:NAD(P)H-quinone oxidoreductase [Mycolicibacterium fluoranthenivorans]|uniref:Putative PIG3 family NAD(P)H quinone oxidoreductase n=1 Tax=Mycolicibacterium fluoranthenivorans TaxID=258505 RepID=A0A7X5U0T0_9MYCO|nr:NAD(P)H-quinone oxidoreductase [Mycolicibacterium fluoranthenivorans]MCV7359895.1 NAD(P)H-quinone oxidoreductase [Mycolicibacterium fluoranthenivorans]NIH96303.1 putative PIG3 family NAD(P)H quinone oxidoreductase [Mycolicibacterium fluoranthenivorans]